jgi:hypothetical protein
VCTPVRLVEFRPSEVALRVPTEVIAIDEDADLDADGVGVGVGVAETEAGYRTGRRLFTSDGRA